MESIGRSHRISSAETHRPSDIVLRNQILSLIAGLSNAEENSLETAKLKHWNESWRQIHQLLVDPSHASGSRDAFRHAGGLQAVIDSIRAAFNLLLRTNEALKEDKTDFFQLVNRVFDCLSEVLFEHSGNRRFFESQVEGSGWKSLQDIFREVCDQKVSLKISDYEALFTALFRFALRDKDVSINLGQSTPANYIAKRKMFLLWNPEVAPLILEVWIGLSEEKLRVSNGLHHHALSVLALLTEITRSSKHNRICMHQTGITRTLIETLQLKSVSSPTYAALRELSLELLQLGANSLDDAQYLFKSAEDTEFSKTSLDFLLDAIRASRQPPHFHFDLSLYGFASLELKELKGIFPPIPPSSGYTFMAWCSFDEFDAKSHCTIFGAFNASQTCFMLLYLERESHQLVLQTSVTSKRPSVRFKTVTFTQGVWYHIAVVHKPARSGVPARAALFVNGEFCDQQKSDYPTGHSVDGKKLSKNLSKDPVQVFLGTPSDLSPGLEAGVFSTRLSVATAHLFSESLTDELIFVYEKLGNRYSGNYQDCLGSFQTYRASAELNLRNEILHAGKEDSSQISAAVRSKASKLNPERKILLNLSPRMCFTNTGGRRTRSYFLSRLSTSTGFGNSTFVANGAIPAIDDTLAVINDYAVCTGGCVIYKPISLEDASWRLSGCLGTSLELLETAVTEEDIITAVNIFFELVKDSWRNSEAMERGSGFGLLAWKLRSKLYAMPTSAIKTLKDSETPQSTLQTLHTLKFRLLSLVLHFNGYVGSDSRSSIIINPMAYRILLVDANIWRTADLETQKLYYEQFISFASTSQYKQFNTKRLNRMRIIKRFLEFFKEDSLGVEVLSYMLQAFKLLVQCSLSSDVMRSLALFITFALHDKAPYTVLPQFEISAASTTTQNSRVFAKTITDSRSGFRDGPSFVSRSELGVKILEVYAGVLCDDQGEDALKRFAKTVTNKWLLHLLSENDERAVAIAVQILARLLVVQGAEYVESFANKSDGFTIIRERLKRWWSTPSIWTACFTMLFGIETKTLSTTKSGEKCGHDHFIRLFADRELKVCHPEILPTISALLNEAIKAPPVPILNSSLERLKSPYRPERPKGPIFEEGVDHDSSVSVQKMPTNEGPSHFGANVPKAALEFFIFMHERSSNFRDFALSSNLITDLLDVLYAAASPPLSPSSAEEELAQDESIDVFSKTSISSSGMREPSDRRTSFIVVTPNAITQSDSTSEKFQLVSSLPDWGENEISFENGVAADVLELLLKIFLDQLYYRTEFSGFGLFRKAPSGPAHDRAIFKSFIMAQILSRLSEEIKHKPGLFCEPKTLTSVARLTVQACEATFEGWLFGAGSNILDFVGNLLTFLQQPDIRDIKSVRLCAPSLATMRNAARRLSLLRVSIVQDSDVPALNVYYIRKLLQWQNVLLFPDDGQDGFIRLLCFRLYCNMTNTFLETRHISIELWRVIIAQEPQKIITLILERAGSNDKNLGINFVNSLQADSDEFMTWLDKHRNSLDAVFVGGLRKPWTEFVKGENTRSRPTARNRLVKRKEHLQEIRQNVARANAVCTQHGIATSNWNSNIQASELQQHQRASQDQQDNYRFMEAEFAKIERNLKRHDEQFSKEHLAQWHLDETEGRDRIRLRLTPTARVDRLDYKPKRIGSLDVQSRSSSIAKSAGQSRHSSRSRPAAGKSTSLSITSSIAATPLQTENSEIALDEDEFEIIPNPAGDLDEAEDKNRKVLRSLQRGERVQNVFNVSRIVGLEACESLLIIGRDSMYLLDNLIQRSDGEIVDIWRASKEERDPYVQLISGREFVDQPLQNNVKGIETRHWTWSDIISISKRRFLFRDVALEVFFRDGRSYLLTTSSVKQRNDVFAMLNDRAPDIKSQSAFRDEDDFWRVGVLKQPFDSSQTLAYKFSAVFNSAPHAATQGWLKGEMSNFHYLMLINTIAGRTFNDLTQYPVFPWVIADYTSEELDLKDPRTFRDFSRPMGCQTPEREAAFKDRYQSFAEMSDHQSPAFHYGTHYSSAMIVTSYLIRLQPFVHSYVLLQGGSFDHADRLFHCIEKAWLSASREGMTDVRELTPEFFYLPDFLTNVNGYNFGAKEVDGEVINNVKLPPWAKGDPTIFIAKHREALESQHVSENLHHWIDLVFGFKQQGEPALEAVNVFHHLSYHGAKDLDSIKDPIERLATIGIIHNFGQTPKQIFLRPHDQRKAYAPRARRLDTGVDSLTKIPSPVQELQKGVATLIFSSIKQRLIGTSRNRLSMSPEHEMYMEWNFTDGSVRFFSQTEGKLLGLFEQLHQQEVTCSLFADQKTLVTASKDCTVAVWTVTTNQESVDLNLKGGLHGHREAICALSTSRALSTIVTASTDGEVIFWDLIRLEFVRKLAPNRTVTYLRVNNSNGHVLLCCHKHVMLYTLNGQLLLEQKICDEPDDNTVCCAFYESESNEWSEKELIFTGHTQGIVNVWYLTVTHLGKWQLQLINRLDHTNTSRGDGQSAEAAITCILPMTQAVYTGDENGVVHKWDCTR